MRHPNHDYSTPGGYFLTFVTYKRKPILGQIIGKEFQASAQGNIVQTAWRELPAYFPTVQLDAFQVMPDHVHCILILTYTPGKPETKKPTITIPKVMQTWKTMTSRNINRQLNSAGNTVWQQGYMDRVIRNEKELDKYRYYIETNPMRVFLARQQQK